MKINDFKIGDRIISIDDDYCGDIKIKKNSIHRISDIHILENHDIVLKVEYSKHKYRWYGSQSFLNDFRKYNSFKDKLKFIKELL